MESSREPEWMNQVRTESHNMVKAIQNNWSHGIELAVNYATNPKDVQNRMRVLNQFCHAMVTCAVDCISAYAEATPEMEAAVVDGVKKAFAVVRSEKLKRKLEPNSSPNHLRPVT